MFYYSVQLLLMFLVSCSMADQGRLFRALTALEKGLKYMQGKVSELNLDAVSDARWVEENIQAMLMFDPDQYQDIIRYWLEELKNLAKEIADKGKVAYSAKDPGYVTELGFFMDENKYLPWYSNRFTSVEFADKPVECADDFFNGTLSDICLSELNHNGRTGLSLCGVSDACVLANTAGNQRGYSLTHQIMYWQMMEKWQCIHPGGIEAFQMRLCSGAMRDANWTTAANYPHSHRDLFMEQIAFCGIWGFVDFHRADWLEKILEWQKPSGCYTDYSTYNCLDSDMFRSAEGKIRVRRTEAILSDGCLIHKTAIAMTALVVMIRFEAEKIHRQLQEAGNAPKY